jgi:peptidyl-tRNA hydrolase
MNLSGKAVLDGKENIPLENLLVIDDLNLSFGTITNQSPKVVITA